MDYPVFSIKDLKGEFWSPRTSQNEDSAKREFAMLVNSGEGIIAFAPQDFELYYLGEFDGKTGLFSPCNIPEFIVRGSELVGVRVEK